MWLRLPLRSLLRNRRRTILSISIIAIGTAVSLFVLGFFSASEKSIQEVTVQEFGTLQIASGNFWDDSAENYEYLMDETTLSLVKEILSKEVTVNSDSPLLSFSGLIASGQTTKVVQATALIPANETLDYNKLVIEGRGLEPSDTAAALIGRSLADELQLKPGNVVTITLNTVNGAFNAGPLKVAGIYAFASGQVESLQIFIPLNYGQALLNTRGVDRLVVMLDDLSSTKVARQRIQAELDQVVPGLEVRTWDKLSPFYEQLAGYFNALFGVVSLAISVLVFFIILQVLTMSFLERTREIATVRALGTKRHQVFVLFFTESLWLAVIGSLFGVVVGIVLGYVFNAIGIEWRPPGTVEPIVLAVRLTLGTAWLPFLIGIMATILSSVFPSIRSARLQVADALRAN
jgi:putative ABC transport system permease protein